MSPHRQRVGASRGRTTRTHPKAKVEQGSPLGPGRRVLHRGQGAVWESWEQGSWREACTWLGGAGRKMPSLQWDGEARRCPSLCHLPGRPGAALGPPCLSPSMAPVRAPGRSPALPGALFVVPAGWVPQLQVLVAKQADGLAPEGLWTPPTPCPAHHSRSHSKPSHQAGSSRVGEG